jgi:TPR repeat protein
MPIHRILAPLALSLLLPLTGCSSKEEAEARAAYRSLNNTVKRPTTEIEIAQDAYAKADFPKALDHFLAAARQGDANAEFYAGAMYSVGDGARKNFREAVKLFESAAAKEQPDALNALARLHVVGDGVDRDVDKAVALYERAIAAYPEGEAKQNAIAQKDALVAVLEEQRNPEAAAAKKAAAEAAAAKAAEKAPAPSKTAAAPAAAQKP